MKSIKLFVFLFVYLCVVGLLLEMDVTFAATAKFRIIVVSSYHRQYLWSQETHAGVCTALFDFNFLDNQKQIKSQSISANHKKNKTIKSRTRGNRHWKKYSVSVL